MGTVVSLRAFKKAKQHVPTEKEEYERLLQLLVDQWIDAEYQHNLNGFIAEKLQIDHQDFISDRNIVAELEADSNITIRLDSPNYSDNTHWVSSFVFGDMVYPGLEQDTEVKARLFSVLLFHALMEAASNTSPHGLRST